MNTKIQLLNQAGNSLGYLDVLEESFVPLNISIADIKDVQKRTGSFSKTITLPGTKNNNQLLNHYYDVNIIANGATFDVNKVQRCLLIQDGIPVLNNTFLQLLNVKKEQSVTNEDDLVRYEVQIKDSIGDFFGKINGLQLTDLDLFGYEHNYTAANVITSFSHGPTDGYKYLMPWRATPDYNLTDFKPGVFAKLYWDQIHQRAGYSYDWSTSNDVDVRFDDLVVPFNGEDKKISEEVNNANQVIVTNSIAQGITGAPQFGSPSSPSQNITRIPPFSGQILLDTEIQDPNNQWNSTTSEWDSPYHLLPPNGIDFIFDLDYTVRLVNNSPSNVTAATSNIQVVLTSWNTNAPWLNAITTIVISNGYNLDNATTPVPGPLYPPGITNLFSDSSSWTLNASNANIGDIYKLGIGIKNDLTNVPNGINSTTAPIVLFRTTGIGAPDANIEIVINSVTVRIKPSADSLLYNIPIILNDFVPRSFKQSDFVRSIMTMYNLFVEIDPTDQNKLIYKHRDAFYDNGNLIDWTHKLARDREQILQFLPELNTKRLVLSYESEDDIYNKTYQDEIKEVYGQQEIIFQNDYVKGVTRKEINFGPTPNMSTIWGANLPLIAGKTKPRILISSGVNTCQTLTIKNYPGNQVTTTAYPVLSHFNQVDNPTFDINFGICDYYFYDLNVPTNNNLYNLFWRRTFAQIDNGKLLTAYFALSPADVAQLKLSDKIRIDNSYWNINKVIDYNAGSHQLTKVELISIDEALRLLTTSNPSTSVLVGITPTTNDPIRVNTPSTSVNNALATNTMLAWTNNSLVNSNLPYWNAGQNNQIDSGLYGIIIGDNIFADEPGLYVGDFLYTFDGRVLDLKNIIDGGEDTVRPLQATNPIVEIDGTEDTILPITGSIRPLIDGGKLEPFE
jgi:hypothetical protein